MLKHDYLCLSLSYCDIYPLRFFLLLLFFSVLSQKGKCVATVRAALVQCLVALLEVNVSIPVLVPS